MPGRKSGTVFGGTGFVGCDSISHRDSSSCFTKESMTDIRRGNEKLVLRLRQPIRRIGLTHTSNPALFPEGRLSAESCADSTLPERPICIGRTLSREALVQGAPASGKLPPGGLLCGGPHKFSSSQQQHLSQGAAIVLPKMCVHHL